MKKGIIIVAALLTSLVLLFIFINYIDSSDEDISSVVSNMVDSNVPNDESATESDFSDTEAFAAVSEISVEQEESDVVLKQPESTTYISQELLDTLSAAILKSTEVDLLKSMVSDRELTEDEIAEYAVDPVVAECIKEWEGYGDKVIILLVDADNDGFDDLYVWAGGSSSSGDSVRILFNGSANGSFEKASYTDGLTQELAFIEYQGKNYLVETNFDFNFKDYCGLTISCFKDGKIYEKVSLSITSDNFSSSIKTLEDKYKPLLNESSEIAQGEYDILDYDSVFWKNGALTKKGAAETVIEETDYNFYDEIIYSCDLNNDGDDETYTKSVFFTSTRSRRTALESSIIDEKVDSNGYYSYIFTCYGFEPKGTPMMFWVTAVDGKNIVSVITYSSITDYTVNGYLINGDNVSEVYEVKFTGIPTVEQSIYTRGINYIDYWENWS